MSKDKHKKENYFLIKAGLLAIVAAGIGIALFTTPSGSKVEVKVTKAAKAAQASVNEDGSGLSKENADISSPAFEVDEGLLQRIEAPRSIGKDDAPVIIHEFSSLSCGHCAKFHNETLERLKQEYVDTGKVKIVFHAFPLNKPALLASLLARCLPQDQYYNFVQLLFKTQEQWAYSDKYGKVLVQNAKLAGLSESDADKCLKKPPYMSALLKNIQNTRESTNVTATPSFIFGGEKETISGVVSYEEFKRLIDTRLKDASDQRKPEDSSAVKSGE